jgi:hypothetical protein
METTPVEGDDNINDLEDFMAKLENVTVFMSGHASFSGSLGPGVDAGAE